MATQIARDPFARSDLMRGTPEVGICNNCGGTNRWGKVWPYYWEQDAVYRRPRHDDGKRFCCAGCYRAYYL